MTRIQRSVLIASAMILTAVLAIFDFIPEAYAQFSPLVWLIFVPWTLAGEKGECRTRTAR